MENILRSHNFVLKRVISQRQVPNISLKATCYFDLVGFLFTIYIFFGGY